MSHTPLATDPSPTPPERPADEECCQSGCDPCIFDLYAEELTKYRHALQEWEARQAARHKSAMSGLPASEPEEADQEKNKAAK